MDANLSSWICFQADLLLLSTSEPHGLCYIETAELDGSDNAARFIPDAQYLRIYRSSGARPLKGCVFVLSCRETNMKVRQSVSVTSDLGDQNNLALFDGEVSVKPLVIFWFWHLLFHDDLKVNPHVFHPRTQQSKHTLLSCACVKRQPIITRPQVRTLKDICVSIT